MPSSRVYRASRPRRSERTRERIVAAVRTLLEEGRFHESSVEEVAERARVSRATLYQHFRSRLDLVDAICETFDRNAELVSIRETVGLPDLDEALARTLAHTVRFWASEQAMLDQLYGAAAVDPAAGDLVRRQRADRRGEIARLAGRLEAAGRLRGGVDAARATAVLLVLTSFETFAELHREGLGPEALTAVLQDAGCALLLG